MDGLLEPIWPPPPLKTESFLRRLSDGSAQRAPLGVYRILHVPRGAERRQRIGIEDLSMLHLSQTPPLTTSSARPGGGSHIRISLRELQVMHQEQLAHIEPTTLDNPRTILPRRCWQTIANTQQMMIGGALRTAHYADVFAQLEVALPSNDKIDTMPVTRPRMLPCRLVDAEMRKPCVAHCCTNS